MISDRGVQQAIRDLLHAIGEDPTRDGLKETPGRVAEMYVELMSGYGDGYIDHLLRQFEHTSSESLVLERQISFTSLCEHHMLPFFGHAHVGYIPSRGKVLGLSKMARVVDAFARRLQVQERMADQIADAMAEHVSPSVAVVIEARHLCMEIRGVEKPGVVTVTSALRGKFREVTELRQEFLSLIK